MRIEPFEYQERPKPVEHAIFNYSHITLTIEEAAKDKENFTEAEKTDMADMIWLAYSNPKAFDQRHQDFLKDYWMDKATERDGVTYVYEFPMLRQWSLTLTEEEHFINMLCMLMSAFIQFEEDDDWYGESTVYRLLMIEKEKEAAKPSSFKERLKGLFSKS